MYCDTQYLIIFFTARKFFRYECKLKLFGVYLNTCIQIITFEKSSFKEINFGYLKKIKIIQK